MYVKHNATNSPQLKSLIALRYAKEITCNNCVTAYNSISAMEISKMNTFIHMLFCNNITANNIKHYHIAVLNNYKTENLFYVAIVSFDHIGI